MAGETEAALNAMGVTLPKASAPAGSYVPVVRTGNLLFVSGQVPVGPNGVEFVGRLGEDTSIVEGQAAARLCAAASERCWPPRHCRCASAAWVR